MSRKIIFIIIALLLAGFIVFKFHHKKVVIADAATFVKVSKVVQANLPLEVRAVGTLTAAKNVQIAPEVAGQISKILFQDGTYVKQGTPLIQLDDATYRAKADAVQADLKFSEASYARLALLAKRGIISPQDLEKAENDLKVKKSLAQENQVNLDSMLLTAPFDGVVGKAAVSPGDYVAVGQALVPLTDTHHLRVEYSVPDKYLADLKLGQTIILTTSAYPDKKFTGSVAYIAPTINTEDRTIAVYADVPNDNGVLTSGLYVSVIHQLGSQNNALVLPAKSLVATIDGQQVFKVVDNKATSVPVVIGERTADNVQVLQGLSLGDMVVTEGQQKIRDGAVVKI